MPFLDEKKPNNKSDTDKKQEREIQVMKIIKYQESERFGEYLKETLGLNYTADELRKRNSKQLNDILIKIRLRLDNRNVDQLFSQMVEMSAVMFEKGVNPVFECSGFAKNLLNNPSFHDAIERYKIELKLPNVPPLVQISYIVTATLITTHEMNKIQQVNQQPQEKEPDIEKKNSNIII